MKRIVSVVSVMLLLILGICTVPAFAGMVQAQETSVDYYWTEQLEVSDYIKTVGGNIVRTAPKPTTATTSYKEWIFAGWFTDKNCDTVYRDTTGIATAKFVSAEVLSAKCQIMSGTSKAYPSNKLRLISTVDSDRYQSVGFELAIDGTTRSYKSKEVYSRIAAKENEVAFHYMPSVFCEEAKYFITGTLNGIPADRVEEGIRITPWWITLDGTRVKGVERYARVTDAYDNIVNVGVRLYSDETVNSGCVRVDYDNTNYKFVGYDAGTVFDAVSANDEGDYIQCSGSIKGTGRMVEANGMFLNLRFLRIGNGTQDRTIVFPVTQEQFNDSQGKELPDFDVADVVYHNGPTIETLADVWGCSSTFKVLQDVDNYASSKEEAKIELKVAKGEYEARQIIISAKEDVSYDFEVSALNSAEGNILSEESINVFQEKYIEVVSNYNNGVTGMYPDAIVPLQQIKAKQENQVQSGDNQGIYVRFQIPNDQPAGVYTGTFRIWISGAMQNIPVTLEIMDTEVSEVNHVKSAYFVHYGSWLGEQDGSQEMMNRYTEMLYDYRLCSANIMLDNCHTDADVQYYTELAYEYMQDSNCSFVLIPTMQEGNSIDKTVSKKYLTAFAKKSLQTGFNMLEKAGAYITSLDEADAASAGDASKLSEGVKNRVQQSSKAWTELCSEVATEIETDTTISSVIKADVVASIRDCRNVVTHTWSSSVPTYKELGVNTFCPRLDLCTTNGRSQYEGMDELWWYGCIYPRSPKPCYQLDIQSLTGIRAMGWMQADYGINGNLFWATDVYTKKSDDGSGRTVALDDYYDTAERYMQTNGDGFLFYPGAAYGIDGPVASLRLEAIRDAFEEYELYRALEERCKAAGKSLDMSALTELLYNSKVEVTAGDYTYAALREALLTACTLETSLVQDYIQNYEIDAVAFEADAAIKIESETVNSSTEATVKVQSEVPEKAVEGSVTLLDFEEYDPDFQLLRVDRTFGKVSQCSDKAYVKSGKYSAKVQPLGGYSSNSSASFYYPLYSQRAGINYKDIRNWKNVTMWVYNAQTVPKEMTIGLVTKIINYTEYMTSEEQKYVLLPGWNEITYIPDADVVNIAYDPENAEGICFTFANAGTRYKAEAAVFYVDNVMLHLNAEYKSCENLLNFDADETKGVYEMIGFDKEFHSASFALDVTDQDAMPEAEIIDATSEGVSATEGNKLLKLTLHPGKGDARSWVKLIIPEKIVRESGFINLTEEERSQYRFVFDVYAKDKNIDLTWEFYTTGLSGLYKPVTATRVSVGQWRSVYFALEDFSANHMTNPGDIRIVWNEFSEEEGEQILYFDNFRYEKINQETQKEGTYTVDIADSMEAFLLCNKLPAEKVILTYTVASTNHISNTKPADNTTGNNGLVAVNEERKTVNYPYNSFVYSNGYNRVLNQGCIYKFTMWQENGEIMYSGGFTHPDGRYEELTTAHLNGSDGTLDVNSKYFGICIFGSTTAKLTNVSCVDENGNDLGLQVNQNNMGTCTIW